MNKKNEKYIWIALLAMSLSYICYYFINLSKQNNKIVSINVREPIIDIGKIKKSNKSVASFELENKGNTKLSLVDVVSDCHCTAANWRKTVIHPEKSFILTVEYDNNKPGFFEQKVNVYFKEKRNPTLLVMRGYVEQ